MFSYQDLLNQLKIAYAHPGGKATTQQWIQQINFNQKKHVLEIGCGTGQTLKQLRDHTEAYLYGIDQSHEMVQLAKKETQKMPSIEIMQQRIEDLLFMDDFFDLIISESVLAFTPIPANLLFLTDLLKPKGQFVLIEMVKSDQLRPEEEEDIKFFYHLPQLFSKQEWLQQFQKHSLDVITAEQITKTSNTPPVLPSSVSEEAIETLFHHFQLNDKYNDHLHTYLFIVEKRRNLT
ncbi:methyltransferase domain-containing protein [Gracilibacillus caseinilyticus]|uniref:Methyltransferase domain-containing protein n=1 Tax=Gracilibacillus caseinilyticus TaxID=2932256 RepID=A0ABY4F297_9BACI|nr:class I SAM-dependent methyltransferase [Gracilibacillus caseinilyticus]UOQ49994.1 methyltransferase domain-containing protein [Gracilibacillus caseinilyticus]